RKATLIVLVSIFALPQAIGFAQSTPMTGRKLTYFWRQDAKPAKAAMVITAEEVQAVLKAPGGDHQIAIVDVGQFNLCVGARPAGGTAAPAGRPAAPAARSQYPQLQCGASEGALAGVNGLTHDEQTETYVILQGTATIVTGGVIVRGQQSSPE